MQELEYLELGVVYHWLSKLHNEKVDQHHKLHHTHQTIAEANR